MSKRLIVILSVSAVLILGAGILYYAQNLKNSDKNSQNGPSEYSAQIEKACDVLSSDKAAQLLGSEAKRDERVDGEESSNDNLTISKCVYQKADERVVSLILRTPKNDQGKQTNSSVFDEASTASGAEKVEGYGDKAFWNAEFGQLNILANNEWYIIEFGSILPSQRNLPESKQFADLISSNF